jgi:hypothetical protein
MWSHDLIAETFHNSFWEINVSRTFTSPFRQERNPRNHANHTSSFGYEIRSTLLACWKLRWLDSHSVRWVYGCRSQLSARRHLCHCCNIAWGSKAGTALATVEDKERWLWVNPESIIWIAWDFSWSWIMEIFNTFDLQGNLQSHINNTFYWAAWPFST